jgi:hypothetical protein
MRRSSGTTRLTSPQSSATSASMNSPVKSISAARLRGQVARQRDGGSRAEETQVHAGSGEARVVRRHGEIALRDELAARRRGEAVHRRDDGLGQGGELLHHRAARCEERVHRLAGIERAHLLQVVAGAESASRTREDHHAHGLVGGEGVELGVQGIEECARQRVVLARAIEDEGGDARVVGSLQERLRARCGAVARTVVHGISSDGLSPRLWHRPGAGMARCQRESTGITSLRAALAARSSLRVAVAQAKKKGKSPDE